MGTQKQAIEIQAIVKTSLEGLDNTIKTLQEKLKSGNLQIDLTKGVGKDLSKLMSGFETSFSKIRQMTSDNLLQIVDAKEFQKESNNIIKTITEIQRITGDLSSKGILDAKKLFPGSFDSRVADLLSKINNVSSTLDALGQKKAAFEKLDLEVQGLTTQLTELTEAANNIEAIRRKAEEADTTLKQTKKGVEELRASLKQEIEIKFSTEKIEEVEKAAKKSAKELKALEGQGVIKGERGKAIYQDKGIGDWKAFAKNGTKEQKEQAEAAITLLQTYNGINTALAQQQKFLEDNKKIQALLQQPQPLDNDKSLKAAAGIVERSEEVKRALENRAQATKKVELAQRDLERAENAGAKTSELQGQITKKTQQMRELDVVIKSLTSSSDLTELTKKFNEITGLNFAPIKENLAKMAEELQKIDGTAYENLTAALEKLGIVTPQTKQKIEEFREGINAANKSVQGFKEEASEMESLKNRIMYFFGLTNSIQLFRRAITSAINTVKELDATMTEAAVVTDFSVGDMWERLPEYSAEANKLGVSINGMYQATTLYYQQGLKNNEAMALGVETMKMARIAGMESAEATEAMTAALRGFNMELNETSAVRVNDVYSQLAAVTAADTEQIATAMSKTASIASAANMEFEATAAFLAQIIETTQEAPETAGTALKTIIARFSEVKSLRDQGLSSGQDAEGEAIDVNKIQTALRSVGISMEGFFAGTEGLDSVLLKLAEKWDTLDFETQRYIATMAAGSRQQSRFIAMMSDYGRTTELVGAAQNSAGASQRQFAKTAESLEAKLTKLKNAWDQFVMGIANDELIKFGVDALTEILNAVNNLTKGLPGLTKSFANLGLAFGGIMLGKKAVGGLLGSVGKSLGEGMGITPKEEVAEKVGGPKIVKSARDIKIQQRSVVTDKETQEQIKYMKQLNQERTKARLAMREEGADIQRLNAQYQNLNIQYNIEKEALKEMTSAYIISGGALDKLNTEEKEALAIAVMNNRITKEELANMDEEALKRALVALGIKAEEEANEDLNEEKVKEVALNHKGILGLIEAIGLRVMGKKAIQGETISLKALVAEKWKNVAATIAENAALIAGVAVVLAVVAAIAMLVVGITKMSQAWKDSANNSKKIEKVNDQINEMQEQITESREELNRLTESKSNLEQLQETFEGLTRGTEEWKQKLVEVNGAVLDLIQEHPELAGYITKGESGQLTVRAEGWDAATAAIEQQIATAVTTQTGLQMKKNHLEQQQALADSSDYFAKQKQMQDYWKSEETKDASGWIVGGAGVAGGAVLGAKAGAAIGTALGTVAPGVGNAIGAVAGTLIGGAIGGLAGFTLGHIAPDAIDALNGTIQDAEKEATGGLTQDEFMAFAAKAQERGVTWASGATQDEFKQIYTEMGYDESIWSDVYGKIQQMGTEFDSLAASSLELRTAQDAYMTSLVSGLAGQAGVDNSEFYDQITEITATSGADKQGEIAAEAEKILSDSDYTGKNGEAKEKLIEEYAAAMGMEKDAVNEKIKAGGLSSETMAQAIAQNKVNEELIAEMQRLEKVMSSLPKSAEGLKNALTSEGKDLRLENIEEFKKATGLTGDLSEITDSEIQKKAIEDYLASQNTSLSALGLDEGDDWKLIWENFVTGSNAFSESAEKIKSWGGQLNQTVTAGVAKALASKIEEQANSGAVGAEEVLNAISNVEADLSDEQVQQLYEALGSFDWKNLSGVESLSAILYDLGFDMSVLGNSIDFLENKIIDFANSTSQLTEQQKAEEVEQAKELIDALQEEGIGRAFTEEEADLIFGDDWEQHFVKSGTKYIYKGNEDQTGLINLIKKEQKMDTTSKEQFEAYEKKTAAEERKGAYDFVQVYARTIARRIPKDNEGDLTARSAGEAAALLGFDPAKVRNSLVMQHFSKLKTGDAGYQYAVSTRKPGTASYAQRLKKANYAEDNYVIFSNGQILDDTENFAYDQKIYKLWSLNKGFALPGLLGDESMDQISEWYENLDQYGKEYFGAISSGALGEYADWQTFAKDSYGYHDISTAKAGYYGEWKSTDWEMLKKIADGALIQDEGDYYSHDEAEQKQITEATVNELYERYINAGANNVTDKANALGQWYKNISSATGEFTQADYYHEMALFSGQKLLSAAEDTRLKKRQEAANDVLDAQINEMTGGTEIVKKWVKGLRESGSILAKNENAVQALALSYNSFNTGVDKFNQVLETQIDYFSLGEKAGQRYYDALADITVAAKSVFGKHIDTTFIEDYKELIMDLSKGGEAASAAWEELTKLSFDNWLKLSGLTGKARDDIQELSKYIDGQNLEIGVATEISGTDEMVNNWNAAVEAMAAKGITLVRTVSKTDENGAPLEYKYLATKSDYTGTGLGAANSSSSEKWENPYDKFYNTLEKINEAMRQREKLERQYQKLIKKGEASANKLTEKKNQQIAALQREAELQNDIIVGRKDQISNLIKEKGLSQYAYLGTNEFTGKSELRIDWDEINKIPDSEKGQEVQDYISKLEEWFGSIEDAEDSLEEIEDNTDELKEQGKDEYLDLEQTIKDALVESYQKQIDELSNINDSINDANSKMLEAMQEQINAYRQSRDNEKAENEIADKQARLAYLQQDTSGANATEILQLEKEIAEAQEGHIDSLIDQKISALQEQNDKAAEQRERQIQIMEAQKDQYETSGEIWKEVEELMRNGLDPDTGLVTGRRLEDILKDSAGFEGMSELESVQWLTETNNKIADALSYLDTIKGALPEVDFSSGSQNNPDLKPTKPSAPTNPTNPTKTEDLFGMTESEVKELQVLLAKEKYYTGAINGKTYSSNRELQDAVKSYWKNEGIIKEGTTGKELLEYYKESYQGITGIKFAGRSGRTTKESIYGFDPNKGETRPTKKYTAQKDSNGVYWCADYSQLDKDQIGKNGTIIYNGRIYPINQYKTGGLADYTGPAWLDGTKSKPELVLNAKDTQNFIQLKDILASLMTSTPKSAEKSGDMSFDIDINVETINDETDLDMIANYIENKIVSSANYRNNTIIGGHR